MIVKYCDIKIMAYVYYDINHEMVACFPGRFETVK